MTIALGVSLVFASLKAVRHHLTREREVLEPPREPKDEEDYWTERLRLHAAYAKALEEYHKLLLWASGGTFVVSYTALQVLGGSTEEGLAKIHSIPLLLLAWLCLVAAVLIAVAYPYTTSRVYAHGKSAWVAKHRKDEGKTAAERKLVEAWGRLNRFLNETSYVLVALAVYLVTAFVLANAWSLRSTAAEPTPADTPAAHVTPTPTATPTAVPTAAPTPGAAESPQS